MDRLHRRGTRGDQHLQAGTRAAHHAGDDHIRRPEGPDDRGGHNVPKPSLQSGLQALPHARRLHMPDTLPLAKTSRRALPDCRVSHSATGNATFGVRGCIRRLGPRGHAGGLPDSGREIIMEPLRPAQGWLIGCPTDQLRWLPFGFLGFKGAWPVCAGSRAKRFVEWNCVACSATESTFLLEYTAWISAAVRISGVLLIRAAHDEGMSDHHTP